MERTERGEIGSGSFQRQVRSDDIHDVTGGANLFQGGSGKETGHSKSDE
jgi:hypothetical protein